MSENGYAGRRVLRIQHRGNVANRMIQYMGALTLAERIRDSSVVNVSIPEFGIEIPDDTIGQSFADRIDLWVADPFRAQVHELATTANRSQSIEIMIDDHLMRMEFFSPTAVYNRVFPRRTALRTDIGKDDLVINIRKIGDHEVLGGVGHYPLLPIEFYADLISQTGLQPVFMGQLDDGPYSRLLRERFPAARFIESQGAVADFDLIRQAHNIVVSVSSFSWLAAWLSEATNIFLPINGFFNPAHYREIDLLPVDDPRYRFFLFPLNYGLIESESIEHHKQLNGRWKEISRAQTAVLKTATPFLSQRWANIAFDPTWYAHTYLDAAMEISEGWYFNPMHHYLEVGRLRGYSPVRPLQLAQSDRPLDLALANLALGKVATQSSICQWSLGPTPEDDARNAVNGNWRTDYAFHTECEDHPWWMVDLGARCHIRQMRIFNRDSEMHVLRRASPLVAEVSDDQVTWRQIFQTAPGQVFGGYRGSPLLWSAAEPVEGRFVRLSVPRREYLHLAEVEIYGDVLKDETPLPIVEPVVVVPDEPDAIEERPRQILTAHGTIIFLVPETDELRHGPEGSVPSNVGFVHDGNRGRLVYVSEQGLRSVRIEPSVAAPSGDLDWSEPGSQDTQLQIIALDEASFGLRSQGLYLCAEPHGVVSLSRHRLDRWESFSLGSPVDQSAE